jgi:hypothetical protein
MLECLVYASIRAELTEVGSGELPDGVDVIAHI